MSLVQAITYLYVSAVPECTKPFSENHVSSLFILFLFRSELRYIIHDKSSQKYISRATISQTPPVSNHAFIEMQNATLRTSPDRMMNNESVKMLEIVTSISLRLHRSG